MFFWLSLLPREEQNDDENNDPKFKWEHLDDIKPLNITFNIDMTSGRKQVGAGGGFKNIEMFCTLCARTSSCVHQPNLHHCNWFCENTENPDWQCYHHQILCTGTREDLEAEVENLKVLLKPD
jgi:hypothetical protein